jgi:threonine synthase
VYYFVAYFHAQAALPSDDIELQFVVPTGNFGDILAGYYAKRMGLPMGQLVVATNANDILARFWRSGRYEKTDSTASNDESSSPATVDGISDGKQASHAVRETLSPAMDILVSSNFERLLWYLAYGSADYEDDDERVKAAGATVDAWMKKVKEDGRVEVPVNVLELARRDFLAERIDDQQVAALAIILLMG